MRESIDRLVDTFDFATADLIEQDRNHNRDRKFKNEPAKTDKERVSNSLPKTSCPEQIPEVLKTYPIAIPNTFHEGIVTEGKLNPVDWQIAENQIEDDAWNNHQPICPIFKEGFSHPDQKSVTICCFFVNHSA